MSIWGGTLPPKVAKNFHERTSSPDAQVLIFLFPFRIFLIFPAWLDFFLIIILSIRKTSRLDTVGLCAQTFGILRNKNRNVANFCFYFAGHAQICTKSVINHATPSLYLFKKPWTFSWFNFSGIKFPLQSRTLFAIFASESLRAAKKSCWKHNVRFF